MKRILLLSIIIAWTGNANAGDIDNAFKYLNTGEYARAYQYLHEELVKEPKSPAVHFGLAKLFSSHDYNGYNIDSATLYINKANAAIPIPPDDKQTKKYLKLGVRDFTIQSLYTDIYKEAYDKATATNTFDSYEVFLKCSNDTKLNEQASDRRDVIKYNEIKDKAELTTLKEFLNNYPHSKKYEEANILYEKLLYEDITHAGTYESYKTYMDKYPTGPYIKDAQTAYDRKLYESYLLKNNLDSYTLFEQYYPKSPYLAAIQDSIYAISTREHRPEDYHHFIVSYPSNKNIIDAWGKLYDIYTQNATDSDYLFFQKMYPNSPLKERIQQDIYLARLPLVPFKQNNKYGYINTSKQELLIQPQYFNAFEFNGGLAAVVLTECDDTCYYTYIDKTGKQAFPMSFSSAGDFVKGRAVVALKYCAGEPCQYGTINRQGQFVIPAIYQDLQPISEGLYVAHNSQGYGFIDETGKIIIAFKYQDATSFAEGISAVKHDSTWIFIDNTGGQLFPQSFATVTAFSSGLAAVTTNDSTFGYINKGGEWAIPSIYEYAEPFEGDTAIVTLRESNKKSKDYGLSFRYKIDKTGKNYYKLVNPNAPIVNTAKTKAAKKRKK